MQFPFFAKKNYQLLYTLLVSKRTVGACVWHVENGKILVDGISDLLIWDEEQEDSLFEAADKAVGSLGEIDSSQVLLSLPDDWVQGQSIHPKRKGVLRDLTEKLELSSVGFVVTIEAVIANLKETSTTPLNIVCASVEPDAFIMAVITQSQSSPILRIGRSDKVTEDFLEGCSRLKITGVPPQMCLISLSESEKTLASMKQELENYGWDPNIFVQPPTIRIESPAFVLNAVTQAGGKEVIKALPELVDTVIARTESVVEPDFVAVDEEDQGEIEAVSSVPVVLDAHTDPEDVEELKTRSPFIVPIILGLLVILLAGAYFFVVPKVLRATVNVKRKSTIISGDTVLTVGTSDNASDSAKIQGALLSLGLSGDIEVPTSGQKKTGDNASGSVTIYNLTAAAKQFKSGTQLKTGKIGFELIEDVTVASASTGVNYEKIPGKATVKAKAVAAGEESNIAKNTELSVAGYDASAFIARNESAFSGGTSRTVQSVAQKDLDSAAKLLATQLQQKISDDLSSKIDSSQDGFLLGEISTSGKKFSKNVGEESTSVSLTMNASASAMVYKKVDALEAAAEALHATIPSGSKLDQSAVNVNRTSVKKLSTSTAEIAVSVDGSIILPIDAAQFTSILAGKSIEDARAFLDSQQAVDTYTLTITPTIFTTFIKTMPKDVAKITILVQ